MRPRQACTVPLPVGGLDAHAPTTELVDYLMTPAPDGPTTTATNSGIEFRFTCNGKTYVSLNYHRGVPTNHKSTWSDAFCRWDEFYLFDACDRENWSGHNNYYGIVQHAARKVGSRGERTAIFPATQNVTDAWHGYPLMIRPSRGDVIPDSLITRWVDQGHLSFDQGERLKRGKL